MSCDDLIPFVDGELPAPQAAAFRVHLADCDPCREHLLWENQLSAHLSCLTPPVPPRRLNRDPLYVLALLLLAAAIGALCR